jgi:MSHA biogenesis protein MshO
MTHAHLLAKRRRGFTLVEMIMVIVITGVIFSMIAVFMKAPIDSYASTVHRAEMTDQADAALRRIQRDVRLSLPNSVRIMETNGTVTNIGTCGTAGFQCYVEFILTHSGGRYRDPVDGSTGGDFLSYTDSTDISFDVLGPTPAMAVGDYVVVYNLGANPANAYNYDPAAFACRAGGCNVARITVAGANVTLAGNPFAAQLPPLPSPNSRFQVIPAAQLAVTYACSTSVPGDLQRYAGYGLNVTQSAPGGTPAIVAGGVTCSANYTPNEFGRNGLLYVNLTLTSGGESVSLFNQLHVDNTP